MQKSEVDTIVDNMTLFADDLMSRVFDDNIPAANILIGTILGKEIKIIRCKGQVEFKNPVVGGRNIRLDIFARDSSGRNFNCEVQNKDDGADPKRARFHSAMMDTRMLNEGQKFKGLRDSYMIFITEGDYFGKGKAIYQIERNVKASEGDTYFGDGSHIIYVNGAYKGDDPIGRLMADFRNYKTTGFNNKEIGDGVRHFKKDKEGRREMCKAVEKYAEKKYNQGMKQGIAQGTEKIMNILFSQVQDGIINKSQAAAYAGLTPQVFEKKMKKAGY